MDILYNVYLIAGAVVIWGAVIYVINLLLKRFPKTALCAVMLGITFCLLFRCVSFFVGSAGLAVKIPLVVVLFFTIGWGIKAFFEEIPRGKK